MIPIGIRYMMISAGAFSIMGMLVKLTYAQGIPILEIIFARCLVSAVLSFIDVKRKDISLLGHRRALLLLRGVLGTLGLICVYYALASLPFAEATVIHYLYPMFTSVLAIIFLRETLNYSTLTCICLSFIGLLLIVRPEFLFGGFTSQYSTIAIMVAVLGAFSTAICYVLIRKLNETEDHSVIIFYFPIIALPMSLLLLGKDFVIPQGWTWLLLLLVGVTTQLGQVYRTKAMKTETTIRASSFSYLQVLFAATLGWLIFNEVPTVWSLLGGGFILLGALIGLAWKRK